MAKKTNVEELKAGLNFGASQNLGKTEETASATSATDAAPEVKTEQGAVVSTEPVVENKEAVGTEQDPGKSQPEQKEPVPGSAQSLAEIYSEKFQPPAEKRTKRIQIVVTPTLREKLDALVEAGKIKSINDLINFLLEGYVDNIK